MPDNIGNINNLISKKSSAPKPKPPSRIEVVERRVERLESTLKTVVKELTALRETVSGLSRPTAEVPPKTETPTRAASPEPTPTPTPTPTSNAQISKWT